MFEREQTAKACPGWWRVASCWNVPKILAFLLVCCVLSGCGAGAATATTATATPLPHTQPTVLSGPFHTTVQTFDGAFTITLDITPNHSGPNRFTARIVDDHAHKQASHIIVTLYTTMQDMAMGTDSIVLHAEGGGQFSATSSVLNMGGNWAIGITIQTANHVIHKAGVNFVLPV